MILDLKVAKVNFQILEFGCTVGKLLELKKPTISGLYFGSVFTMSN